MTFQVKLHRTHTLKQLHDNHDNHRNNDVFFIFTFVTHIQASFQVVITSHLPSYRIQRS